MKLIFFLLVLLKNGMNPAKGLRALYSSEQIILKYSFDPIFNSYEKVCCKFDQSVCSTFVNNRGQLYNHLNLGRIFINNYSGEFEVRITHLSVMDAGMYSCGFRGVSWSFESVEVTFSDVWPSSPSTTIVSENDAEQLSCRTSIILLAGFSLMVFAAVLAILLVFFLKNRKKQSKDTSGTCSSLNASLEVTYILQNNRTIHLMDYATTIFVILPRFSISTFREELNIEFLNSLLWNLKATKFR
ncbi:uncharacterized protein LOC120469092 isoform X2 [Pimephales promelas]|uniref:uncharacterized protein LOC120469092 isoform X2 n=1 Tax=Pimephales promelas TaxID=90988 RepID=UPI0019557D99|nr:uncharacterized protein LOC120469092 isoform X2 [Pimephales promelas]